MTQNRGCGALKPGRIFGPDMSELDRRDLIGAALLLGSTAHIASAQAASVGAAAPRDAQYWRSVADQYDITREIVPFGSITNIERSPGSMKSVESAK